MDSKEKLNELMIWLGADAYHYLSIRKVFEQLESHDDPRAQRMVKTLDEFHHFCSKIINESEV
jgi:hypothetical protein